MAGGITQQTKNLGDTWGEFKEQIGKGLADEFSAILKGMNAFLKSMTEGLDRHQKYLKATAINATATDKLAYERAQLASQQAKQADYVKMGNQLVILQNARDIAATEERIARLLHEQNREMRTGVTSVGADSTGYEGITIPSPALGGSGAGTAASPAHVIIDKMDMEAIDMVDPSQFRGGGFDAMGDMGIGSLLGEALGPLGDMFMGLLGSLGPVMEIMDPIGVILKSMFEVLGPLISEALAPLLGILKIFGKIFAATLIPILNILTPVIEGVAKVMLWFANKVMIPVSNFIIGIWNGIARMINSLLGWLGVNIAYADKISAVTMDDATTAGASSTTPTSSTGGASYSGSQSITFNFYNQGNVVGSGGLEELATLINNIITRNARYA
jgi:hypothetical protein